MKARGAELEAPLQILIYSADAARAALIEEGLREPAASSSARYVVHHVRELSRLLPSAATTNPRAMLIDLGAPEADGLATVVAAARVVKRPIVVFVDRSDAASARMAIDAGVAAYIVDGLRKERIGAILTVATTRHEAISRLEAELSKAQAALQDRKIIERAKSILMQREGLSEEAAYTLLRRTAMNQNRKIADLARAIVAASPLFDAGSSRKREST